MIRATRGCAATACRILALIVAFGCGPVQAQQGEPAMLKRPAELRDAPGETGRALAALPAQEPVTRLGPRQGPWIQVQTGAGVAGWVHMFDVGPAAAGAGAAPASGNALGGGLRGITSLFRGSSPAPRVATSTIGIRGLEAEDLARAQPDLNAVGRMERLRQDENGARQFAAEAALAAATVPALLAPPRGSAPQGGNSNPQQQ